MERQSGVASRIFEIMAEQDIRMKMISTSETKIFIVLPREDEKRAVESIMEAFRL
ncbi:ACT domain-containing protein [Eubacteriales bacterium mix99]